MKLLVRQTLDLPRLHRDVLRVQDSQLVCNGPGGNEVVPGQHFQLNARAPAAFHRLVHVRPDRVRDGRETVEHHVRFQRGAAALVIRGRPRPSVGKSDHAAGFFLKFHDLKPGRLPFLYGQAAQLHNPLRASLCQDLNFPVPLHHGSHVFGLRAERVDVKNFRLAPLRLIIPARLTGGKEQRALGGVSDKLHLAVRKRHIRGAVQAKIVQQMVVLQAVRLQQPHVAENIRDRHTVLRQRSRLVRTDHVDTAHRLAGDHLAHQCILL